MIIDYNYLVHNTKLSYRTIQVYVSVVKPQEHGNWW